MEKDKRDKQNFGIMASGRVAARDSRGEHQTCADPEAPCYSVLSVEAVCTPYSTPKHLGRDTPFSLLLLPLAREAESTGVDCTLYVLST